MPGASFTEIWTATRHNGIAAGEKRWGDGLWDEIGISKEDILALYPQTQEVVPVIPVLP